MESITVNKKTFSIIKLLGKGKGGYSYLVSDGAHEFVVKQIHHEPCDYYQFGDKIQAEINDYKKLNALQIRMPQMIDADIANERILKEYINGETIETLVAQNKMKETYFEQVRAMCKALYAAGLNIDYYPTNFVVQNDELFYIDYECNEYSDKWNFENWGIQYWKKKQLFFFNFVKDFFERTIGLVQFL